MKKNDRRKFLKDSLLGLSGVALLPGAAINKPVILRSEELPVDLPSRNLGRTGIKTPLISLGAAGATDPGFIRAAYEAGVKLFFSATYYGEGNNEKLVGQALKNLPRDSFVIGTACPPDGMDMQTGTFPKGFDAAAYLKKAEGSLQRFGLEYVDIFLFPYAGKKEVVQNEDVIRALGQLKKQGRTKFVGIASHSGMEEALRSAADSRTYDVAMVAYNFKAEERQKIDSAISYASKAGLGIVAMKTTAGAFRNKTGPQLNTNAALKWVLQNGDVSSIVSGMSTLEQLNKNLAMISNIDMTDEEQKELDISKLSSGTGLYCHQCKQCIPQCPHNLDIPSIMRSYMYAYGYKNMEQAWYTISNVDLNNNACEKCTSCNVRCRAGFNVKDKILDIGRLKEIPKDLLVG
jgi:predicted aldo/keto reductase-like oxidoreductase